MNPILKKQDSINSSRMLWWFAVFAATSLRSAAEPTAAELESNLAGIRTEEAKALSQIQAIDAVIKEREGELMRLQIMAETLDKQLTAFSGPTDVAKPVIPEVSSELQKQQADLVETAKNRVVVLHGKEGPLGIGFLAEHDGIAKIFTPASLVSRNGGVSVMGLDGEKYPTGDGLSCPTGVDMVCLHPIDTGLPRFELASANELQKVGDQVVVIAVDGQTQTLSGTGGTIRGIGPDVLELDAALVPEMNGAPVLALASGKVIGIVTPQVDGVASAWAVGTRHQEARSFAARLDRIGHWQAIDLARYVKEAAFIQRINDENHIAWLAYMLLQYGKGEFPGFAPLHLVPNSSKERSENSSKRSRDMRRHRELMESLKAEAKTYATHPQIKRAQSWLNGGLGDRSSLLRNMVDEVKIRNDISGKFTWYHAKQYKHALDFRREGIRAMTDSAENVGR